MNHDRSYYRSQRERAISRKEKILLFRGGSEHLHAWTNGQRGRLSKGKIHCSCWLCRRKSYDALSHRDERQQCGTEVQMDTTA